MRKMSRANFLAGLPLASAGDIQETTFVGANNQNTPANVTGFAFAGTVRAFTALAAVTVDATSDLYEQFTIDGINRDGSWQIAVQAVGDESGVVFSITTGGQIQYISGDYAGFASLVIKFRAITITA